MAAQHQFASPENTDRLTQAVAALGYEIVDIAGFLDLIEEHARAQRDGVEILTARARDMQSANLDVIAASRTMAESTAATVREVESSIGIMRAASDQTRTVAGWVTNLADRTERVSATLSAVKSNNQQIAAIANQVNTLAINAKIEAARAGEAGHGFAVVAEAINELSRKTKDAAVEISDNIENLTTWIASLGKEAGEIAGTASDVLVRTGETDEALGRMEATVSATDAQAQVISAQSDKVNAAIADFSPALSRIDTAVKSTSEGIVTTHERVMRLIDTSEVIVQKTAQLGGISEDTPFIEAVLRLSAEVSAAFEDAVDKGRISLPHLLDRTYTPVPDTDPKQFVTQATQLLDEILPPIQEPALKLSPKVVFCAAVDINGYLPTHNRKFSQPQGDDPVWNAANCRNRRVFDDRVGLKAGRNTDEFLLQVYRRDMGGGTFKMMKDLSAPIFVKSRHWGGLRLAYTF